MPKPLCLVDTSILLNILNVPGKNECRDEVFAVFREKADAGETFFLPLATIIETGNHIGHLPDGNERYGYACALVREVQKALDGTSPFVPLDLCSTEDLRQWMNDFPHGHAVQGRGVGDMMLVGECLRLRERHPSTEVYIWPSTGLPADINSLSIYFYQCEDIYESRILFWSRS